MGAYWKLNGVELTAVQVRVVPTKLVGEQRVRQAKTDLHGDTQFREKVGRDLPTVAIEFSFFGRGDPKYDTMTDFANILDDDEVWTLEAPSDLPVFIYKSNKRAALSTDSWDFNPGKSTGKIVLSLQATINGVWAADGGSYCETTSGSFTLQVGAQYRRDSDSVVTGIKPLLRLPQQHSGYPIAVNSVYQYSQPPIVSSVTIGGLVYQDYDMTGFLHPAPAATGDVGVYEACSSPSVDFLNGPVEVAPPPELSAQTFTESGSIISEEVLQAAGVFLGEAPPIQETLNVTNT